MPSCAVCGEQDFEAKDGLFYCTTCMTQSQDLREEEKEDDAFDTNVGRQIKAKKTTTRKAAKKDYGRPWNSYEAFQLIIKEQVKALINMGADPKLKEVVFRLWCAYLSKCGIAFPADSQKQPPFVKKAVRHRERYPPTLADPRIIRGRYIKTQKMATGGQQAKLVERMQLTASMQGEEFYDSDNPMDDDESENESLDESYDSGDGDSFEKHKHNKFKQRYARDKVEWMKISKTLSFCYMGLMYTNPMITAVDIIRWSREDKIPYITASKLLPSDMKFSCYDSHTFVDRFLVQADKLRSETRRLIVFLELNDIPVNRTRELINMYLIQLNLPGELHGLVQSLREVCLKSNKYYLEKDTKRTIAPFETVAMAYIVTVLEILLGLDNNTEKELSRLTEELLLLCQDHKLFVWDRWVNQKDFERMKSAAEFQREQFNAEDVVDVEAFMKSCSLSQRIHQRYSAPRLRRRRFQPNVRKNLCQPLKLLSNKLQSTQPTPCDRDSLNLSTNQIQDNSFDMEQDYIPDLQQTLLDDPIYNMEDAAQEHDTESSYVLFRDKSLAHICQPKTFLKNITSRNVKSKDYSNSDEGGTEDDMKDEEPDYTDVRDKHKMRDIKVLIRDIIDIHVNRKMSVDWGFKGVAYSPSYSWLLDICSGYILCSSDELNNTVNELQLFLVKYPIYANHSNDLLKFIRRQLCKDSLYSAVPLKQFSL